MTPVFFKLHPEHLELWEKLQEFEVDTPGTQTTFLQKLATKNHWTLAYAQMVIDEYKKFIFLCSISPTGASPSKAVDEAWHLHLTYTHSYWDTLCKEVLGFELHHYPSKGGENENQKHVKWYEETLVLYTKVFETTPPADVWPPAHPQHDDVVADFTPGKKQYQLAGLILLIPFIVSFVVLGSLLPFALDGSEFLDFFFLLTLAALCAFGYLNECQQHKLRRFIVTYFPGKPTLADMGSYNTSNGRLLQIAVLDLIAKNVLVIGDNKNLQVQKANLSAAADNPLYAAIEQVDDGYNADVKDIARRWFKRGYFINESLEQLKKKIIKSYKPQYWIFAFILIIGLIRLVQGWISGYPTSYLILMLLIASFVYFLISVAGRPISVLNRFAQEHLSAQLQTEKDWQMDAAKRFAVYGTESLKYMQHAAIVTGLIFSLSILEYNHAHAAASSGGCGGAAGGDGGGDGGGGGCGGGCGGCGGCGG